MIYHRIKTISIPHKFYCIHLVLRTFAKELIDAADIIICHAIERTCSVIHTVGHVLGYPVYDLTAIVLRYGAKHCKNAVALHIREYEDRLLYWEKHTDPHTKWGDFILK